MSNEITRRHALTRIGQSVTASALMPTLFTQLALDARAAGRGGRSGRKLILLWLEGGPSQMETFDPKQGHANGGPFGAIPTSVQGWSFCETLPGLAKRAEQLAVIRSMTSAEGNHSRARELVKTGYVPNPSVSFPSLGSIVSSELAAQDFDLPAYIQVSGAPSPSGYLGVEHSPLVLSDPEREIDNLDYALGVNTRRMDHREKILGVLEDGFEKSGGARAVDANRSLRSKARRLMDTELRSVFDLNDEKERLRDRYGRNLFGQGCLLARRLVESGVAAVEVVLAGWDTHTDNFNRSQTLCEQLDAGFSTLLDDLGDRSLTDEVTVVCMGEFGRTPTVSANDGRNHWPRNWCATLAGGGIQTGQALGETSPDGTLIADRPVTVPELFATLSRTLGFDPDIERVVNNRPITLVDPEGRSVPELLRS